MKLSGFPNLPEFSDLLRSKPLEPNVPCSLGMKLISGLSFLVNICVKSHFRGVLPGIVLEPTSVQEVSEALKYCNEVKCPVVAFGTGTGMEGGAISTRVSFI